MKKNYTKAELQFITLNGAIITASGVVDHLPTGEAGGTNNSNGNGNAYTG